MLPYASLDSASVSYLGASVNLIIASCISIQYKSCIASIKGSSFQQNFSKPLDKILVQAQLKLKIYKNQDGY